MSARLKYNPACYKRLAEIAGWLANGENVQVRPSAKHAINLGRNWVSFGNGMGGVEYLTNCGCEFRIKPTKETK